MTNVYLAEDYHGCHYIFSTRALAEDWLAKELYDNFGDIDLNRPQFEVEEGETSHSIYFGGELVGAYERYEIDGPRIG